VFENRVFRRIAGHITPMGDMGNAYKILVGKPEGMRLLKRPGRKWEDIIKMALMAIVFGGMDWIHLALNRNRWRVL
jgi:hypothetical protein